IYDRKGTELYLDFRLDSNAEYTVTIPGDAADPYGNTLGQDYTFSFRTPEGPPIASFNLPQRISQLSTSFATEVDIINRNVSQLNVTLHNLGLPVSLVSDSYSVQDYRPAAAPIRNWSLTPETARGAAGVTTLPLADGGALPTGVYLLTMNAPELAENSRYWQNQRALLIVGDTNIVVKEMNEATHVWVTDLNSGQPAGGRNLALYNRQGTYLGAAVSDNNGFASFITPPDDYFSGMIVVSNNPGEVGFGIGASVWNEGVTPWQFGLDADSGPEPQTFAYIYTDRPIYRPGDTIYFKGIVRDAHYGRYNLPSLSELGLGLSAAFYFNEGGLEESFTVAVDPDGTFNGEYTIPDDVDLGTYQLFIRGGDYRTSRQFSIAEYRKPEFLLTMSADQPELLRGETAVVTLEAGYFFGGPATDLHVEWTVYEDNYRPDVPGPYYYFGDGGNFFYRDYGLFGPSGSSLGNHLINGGGITDENGRLAITLPADLLKDAAEGSRKVTIEASVSDLANFPVSTRTAVTFHAAETYVGVIPSNYMATAGTAASVDILTVDWDGAAKGNQSVEVVFYKREWNRIRDEQHNVYFTRWEPVDAEVDRMQVTTDGQGKAAASFVPEEGGTYLAVAAVTDGGGRAHTSSATLWAVDSRYIGWRTDPREKRMDLLPDKTEYAPGETAQILVQSPFAGPIKAWLTIERGELIEQRVITLQTSSDVLDIPIPPEYAPNVHVSVVAMKPVRPESSAYPWADMRLGITELVVSPEQLALNVELTPRNAFFAPRETAVFDIKVTNHRGQPVQADLSLALVDLAVLTLKPDNSPDIHETFYARQPYRSQVGSGLIISGEGLEVEIPLESGGLGGGGGGMEAEAALTRAAGGQEEDTDVRKDFRDTAYWTAHIAADANGQAVAEIPLPDNLTTWRLSGKAADADSLVGQSSSDIIATLPLLLRPQTPRFFTVGDVLQIGTIVNNNTSGDIEATVSLDAFGLTLSDPVQQTVTIAGNGRQLVQWGATVDDVPFADLTFRVEGGGYSDATKPTFGEGPDQIIPVYRYDAHDIVGTSGVLDEPGRRVEAVLLPDGVDTRLGSVDVTLSPSLAAALLDALEAAQRNYPITCPYSATDLLLPNAATARAIVELGLDEPELAAELDDLIQEEIGLLEGAIHQDGGWGWCFSERSSPWLSAYALLALTKAEQAGFGVDTAVLDRAALYLEDQLQAASSLTESYEINRQAFFLYVLAETGVFVDTDVDALFAEHRALLDPYAKALLALTYQLNDNQGANQRALLSDLNDAVVISATGAHWEDASRDYRNLSSDVRGTAVIINA
ncbi:MAG: hypothetical protein GY803_00685, partial [Chloroflexi bacterium]|nr:hypothetical protein [Chloroflexota bacterium]